MLVRPGFEPATSRSVDRRSPNWANQAAGWGMSLNGIDSEPCRIYLSIASRLYYLLFLVRIENQTKLFSKTSFNERLWEISSFLLCLFHRKGFGGSQLPFALKPVQSTFKAALGRSLDLREKAMISHDSLVMSWLPWVPLTPLSRSRKRRLG